MISRRRFGQSIAAAAAANRGVIAQNKIDREALVRRHHPVLREFDLKSALAVGNGEFAFTADLTGLQTFPALYEKVLPLCTQAQWGWHSFPNPKEFSLERFQPTLYSAHGREVPYVTGGKGQEEAYGWLRENPHRLNLAQIGLILAGGPEEVRDARQELQLWLGLLTSSFLCRGARVEVETCCHPELDLLAVRVRGAGVRIAFPYGSPGMNASDWAAETRHTSELRAGGTIARTLDGDSYSVRVAGSSALRRTGAHTFELAEGKPLEVVIQFGQRGGTGTLPTVAATQSAARTAAKRFWMNGGAVEVAENRELERRVVLSQYLTATQCAGSLPPQETGLTCNSWNGKFHMEMYWWHAGHFAFWGRAELLERSLGYYGRILNAAQGTARRQGYAGARWPKMTAADGRESPSPIGPLLIWQQPHPIALAEAVYRAGPSTKVLERYAEVVFATADFMASYAVLDGARGAYVLGPPVIPAQENHPPQETWNPCFELEYWAWGLAVAQRWRERLKLSPKPGWEAVRARIAPLPVKDGVYLAHENCPQTYTERNRDHPSMLMAMGTMPGIKADGETMRRTLRKVLSTWKWPDTWGWDYPMIAMTAARLGDPSAAVDALLMDTPKNQWAVSGQTWQRANLPVYLPSNGALLLAVAQMTKTAWKAKSEKIAPYF